MRSRRRPRAISAVVAVLAALSACGASAEVHSKRAESIGGSTPTDTSGTTPSSGFQWGPCDDPNAQDPALQCATVQVPLDYDNPTGDKIDLALIRYPATGTREGAVLFNPGGPGGSGFDFIAYSGSAIAAGLGIDTLDVIGFDPRGVDRSGGLHCVTDQFEDQRLFVDESPDTPEETKLKDEAITGFTDGCRKKYGDTLRFYSTENTARDMDAIRAAIGDEQISYLGVSYGTYLGAAYATLFPDRVRAMVLDSAFEPNGDTMEQEFKTQLVGFEGAFNNWIAWCEQAPNCAFATTDIGARWDSLRQRLDDTPIKASDGRLANNAVLETATVAALYSESDWPVLAQALSQAEAGDPAGIFALADAYNRRNDDGTYDTLDQSYWVIQCASGWKAAPPADPDALAATLRAAAPRFGKETTGADLIAQLDQCNALVGKVSPVALKYAGDGPVVVIGGTNDPATPIRWAQKMTGELGPNARLVTFTGEGHGQLLVNSCVTDVEGKLLASLKLPDPDTVCDPDPVIAKPDWWDSLPVPEGVSDVVQLPALNAALGATPTQVFSEMRTTKLSPDDAVAAYTDALSGGDFRKFDAPQSIPIDDISQGAYSDFGSKTFVVEAIGPKAFDDKALQSARAEVPPDTTVVWLIAVDG